MAYEEILYAVQDRVATITLNRPAKLNAWTKQMEDEVSHSIRAAAADGAVRVIVLTGAGRGFCAGADMSLLQSIVTQGGPSSRGVEQHAWMLGVSKPIVAAINGPAVGL